jgi:teichuronic acid biosynthesis glycosyltransferase TuaH
MDVVVGLSQLTWRTIRARGMHHAEDRLVQTLLDHPRVDRLLVANQLRSAPIVLARRLRGPEDAGFPADGRHALVQPLRLRRTDPSHVGTARREMASYDRTLRRAAARLGLEAPAVITANPVVAGFAELAWAGSVTYYAVDDWAAHPAHRRLRALHLAAYERIRARGIRVCAVSRHLLDVMAPTGPAAVVPNGVAPLEWLDGAGGPGPARAPRRGPLLVYVGTIDSRLDVGGLVALARALPEATIALAGDVTEPDHVAALRELPSVQLRAPLDRAGVVALLREADVCLLPHVETPLTASMSPLKLYEYLAAGRPVVATALPPVVGVSPRVVEVAPAGDLADGVRRALALGPASEAERCTFVAEHAWSRRHEAILDLAAPR